MAVPVAAISLAVSVGSQLFKSWSSSRAAKRQRDFARRQARDVITRGEEDVAAYQRDLSQLLGQQRVGAGAQGLDVNQGSVAEIRQQTETFGEQDVAQIRENARRQAWGIRAQANLDYRAATNQAIAGAVGAVGNAFTTPVNGQTLLGRAEDAWSRWAGSRAFRRRPGTRVNNTSPFGAGAV